MRRSSRPISIQRRILLVFSLPRTHGVGVLGVILLVGDKALEFEFLRVVQVLCFRGGAGMAVHEATVGGGSVAGGALASICGAGGARVRRRLCGFRPCVDGVDVEEYVDDCVQWVSVIPWFWGGRGASYIGRG